MHLKLTNSLVICILIALLLSYCGCLCSDHYHSFLSVEYRLTKSAREIYYLSTNDLPKNLELTDCQEIGKLIGRISILNDPICVKKVISPWQNVKVTVLYKISFYDIYIVRDNYGKWVISEIQMSPTP